MGQEKLYYPYSEYLRRKYGEKVYKLPVNLPVSCPNRENAHGCVFCAPAGAGFEAAESHMPVTEQLEHTRERIERNYHAHKFIAYFQNYTNTYLALSKFSGCIAQAAGCEDIAEICVSTRPDCIAAEYLDVLNDVKERFRVGITVELGLQTANYRTLEAINRGHTLAEYIDAVLAVKSYGFDVCTHVILNLPDDDRLDVKETAKLITALKTDTVKIHSLYIAKNTQLCEAYEHGTIVLCDKHEYFERLILFLEYLSPDIAVERLFSRIPKEDAVFCNWGASWWKLKDELLMMMENRKTFQGRSCNYLGGSAVSHLRHL